MSETLKGFVKIINSRGGKSRTTGKPWVLYSFILELDSGEESGWISAGFESPPFNKGDYVQVSVDENDRGLSLVAGSAKTVKNPPARKAPGGGGSGSPVSNSQGTDWDARQRSIEYQSARNAAIDFAKLLVEVDGLPISKAANKSGQGKRLEEMKEIVDKLTVQFYNDLTTGRILSTVQDAGAIEKKADSALPEPEEDEDSPNLDDFDES